MKPSFLKKGDTIAIVAPAKAIEVSHIDFAKKTLEDNGFHVLVAPNCLGQHNYFSGTINERTQDLQWAINHENVKAILCARGGYGCIQLVERINWASFMEHPKWIIGFSDVTVFHQYLAAIDVASIHATMPLNFKNNSILSLESLFFALEGKPIIYNWKTTHNNTTGEAYGDLIGGNLAVLTSMIGTKQMPNFQNKILFIEDVGEHLYKIDRYFHQLSHAGVLDQIRALIIGDFSGMQDTEPPYGKSLEKIIETHFTYRSIPLAFGFPAGHTNDNRALPFGVSAKLSVQQNHSTLIIGEHS
ncbi:LD-carboxypeptidase [Brumimicrobium salinarum]|uniref:LD-carboxypeptidase n=1 Tax=Brumimicrobium salinarum TaxID=2058658 RepID=A0A2I0R6R0_9FLAO|nr:LD-carboxypeptidase [Brumimicrobium salinarum]PKR82255.1 LD-carboxypeptidase [Brumimicrobium salinarum]